MNKAMKAIVVPAALAFVAAVYAPAADAQDEAALSQRTGRQIFLDTCAACHAPDGKGHSRSRLGFDVAPPDFTDPDFASREPHSDWVGIARNGGPSRGFSEIMPSFRDALTTEELEAAVTYVKSLHGDDRWPPGSSTSRAPSSREKPISRTRSSSRPP
ncbi:MAG: cytochrome c [Candidatus Moduliflexus flocculans]|nr:cytochrome c [Candidatus Moduliflexus flocculans]